MFYDHAYTMTGFIAEVIYIRFRQKRVNHNNSVPACFTYALINPLESKGNYSATSNNTNMAVDVWAVTFGIARRGLGRLRPRPVPSSLYQM